MNTKLILNGLKRTKLSAAVTLFFVSMSTLLCALIGIILVNMLGSIDALMVQGKTPHFLVMHKGEIADEEAVLTFQKEQVSESQISKFLNIENSAITLNETVLTESTQDNGVTVQNERFDYLLDLDGNQIHAEDGTIYLPTCYVELYDLEVGQRAKICGRQFVIAGFLRDSQMSSMMASSKRFLVSRHDYEELKPFGSEESIIEYRLKNTDSIAGFSSAYLNSGLPQNGPSITYGLVKLMNALTEGIMVGVLALASVFVLLIGMLCIKFTLLESLDADYEEIGVLKAIGTKTSEIKRIYFQKYGVISVFSVLIGLLAAMCLKGKLLETIYLNFGLVTMPFQELLLGLAGAAIALTLLLLYVNGVLRKIKSMSTVNAVRGDNKNVSNLKLQLTVVLIFVFCTMLMILPHVLATTLGDKSLVACMGIGETDIRIDGRSPEQMTEMSSTMAEQLKREPFVEKLALFTTKAYQAKMMDAAGNGEAVNLYVELGDHEVFPVTYKDGKPPVSEEEIALSSLNAKDLGAAVGSKLLLCVNGEYRPMKVVGIYVDITNGGKSAKACFADDTTPSIWSIFYLKINPAYEKQDVLARLKNAYPSYEISDIVTRMLNTYGETIRTIKKAGTLAVCIALGMGALISVLFLKLMITREQYEIAVRKICGFLSREIAMTYCISYLKVALPGILIGVLFTKLVGENLTSVILGMMGIEGLKFVSDPFAYLVFPVLLAVVVMLTGYLVSAGVKHVKERVILTE